MADSVQKQLLDEIQSTLTTLTPTPFADVGFTKYEHDQIETAMEDPDNSGLPYLLVTMSPKPPVPAGCGFWTQKILVTLVVKAQYADDPGDIDPDEVRALMDSTQQALMNAMEADFTWGGLAVDTQLPVDEEDETVISYDTKDLKNPSLELNYDVTFNFRSSDLTQPC